MEYLNISFDDFNALSFKDYKSNVNGIIHFKRRYLADRAMRHKYFIYLPIVAQNELERLDELAKETF